MKSLIASVFFGIFLVLFGDGYGQVLITNGNRASPGQFPYDAALFVNNSFWCGGSLISRRWVLTAAHCITGVTTGFEVRLGVWNISAPFEEGQQRPFSPIKNVIVHEEWDPNTILNDIALIKLPKRIHFSKNVTAVKLPKKINPAPTYANHSGIVSGWGDIDTALHSPDILQWIKQPIMSNADCDVLYPGRPKDSRICLDTRGGKSPCFGDSGAPLILADGSPVQIGLVSFGDRNCLSGTPTIFTRITYYLDWIGNHTGIISSKYK